MIRFACSRARPPEESSPGDSPQRGSPALSVADCGGVGRAEGSTRPLSRHRWWAASDRLSAGFSLGLAVLFRRPLESEPTPLGGPSRALEG